MSTPSGRELPDTMNVRKLVERQGSVTGVVKLGSLVRLQEICEAADSGGEVDLDLQFGRDARGYPVVTGHWHATVKQQCQRCLEPVLLPIESDVNLGLRYRCHEQRLLQSALEDTSSQDVIESDDEFISIFDLVTDEILLALPIVPLHEHCSAGDWQSGSGASEPTEKPEAAGIPVSGTQAGADDGRPNPFAVLAELKTSKRSSETD